MQAAQSNTALQSDLEKANVHHRFSLQPLLKSLTWIMTAFGERSKTEA